MYVMYAPKEIVSTAFSMLWRKRRMRRNRKIMIDVTSFLVGLVIGTVVVSIIWIFNPFGRR